LQNTQEEAAVAYLKLLQLTSKGDFPINPYSANVENMVSS
jgi:hypothetical protein